VAQQRRGLGRGLGALIPESPLLADGDAARGTDPGRQVAAGEASSLSPGDPVEVFGAHYKEIAVSSVVPNPRQPRRRSTRTHSTSLRNPSGRSASCSRWWFAPPGRAGTSSSWANGGGAAAQRAGLTEIGAIVKQTQDDDLLRDALIENLHRQQLDPLEEAAAYQQLPGRFRRYPRGTRAQDRPIPPAHQQYPPPAEPAAGRPETGGGGVCLARATPGPCSAWTILRRRSVWRAGSWRGSICPRCRGDRRGRRRRLAAASCGAYRGQAAKRSWPPPARRPPLRPVRDAGKGGTWQRKGKIVVEFATIDDLERIVKAMSPEVPEPESSQ